MSKRAERRREIEQQERRQQFVRVAEQEQESYIWDNDPVKQYVRHYGWLDIISGYVARRQSAGIVDPIKYLTLPGAHAIDIGYLCRAGIIQPARGTPRFPQVVICDRKSAAQVNANLGGVLAASNKSLSSAISGTTSELARYFPFDVINFDATHPIIFGLQDGDLAYALEQVNALEWMFRLQRGQSFLFLLTTRPDVDAGDILRRALCKNLREYRDFSLAYQERYGSTEPEACLNDFTGFTQIILSKLVAGLAKAMGYAICEHFTARYRRPRNTSSSEPYDMICHSFELERLDVRNPAKKYIPRSSRVQIDGNALDSLSSVVQSKADESYRNFITDLLRRGVVNIVDLLRNDPELERMLDEEARSLNNWWVDRHGFGSN